MTNTDPAAAAAAAAAAMAFEALHCRHRVWLTRRALPRRRSFQQRRPRVPLLSGVHSIKRRRRLRQTAHKPAGRSACPSDVGQCDVLLPSFLGLI